MNFNKNIVDKMESVQSNTVDNLKDIVLKFLDTNSKAKVDTCDDLIETVVVVEESNDKNKVSDESSKENNAKEHSVFGFFSEDRKKKAPEFWVQFNMSQGRNIPPGGGPPLMYEPDRNEFVRIVFTLVFIMLLATASFVGFVYMTNLRKVFLKFGFVFFIPAMIGMIGLNYAMMLSSCTRMPPCNYFCLLLSVVFMSTITAYITVRYNTEIILYALIATLVTVAVCIGLACTSFDFTKFLIYLVALSAAFAAIVIIYMIVTLVMQTRMKTVTLVILFIGTLLNVAFLIMELQMILGGRAVELSEDDYALGAFMLYTSILDIFLKLLQIIGILDE